MVRTVTAWGLQSRFRVCYVAIARSERRLFESTRAVPLATAAATTTAAAARRRRQKSTTLEKKKKEKQKHMNKKKNNTEDDRSVAIVSEQ